MGSSSTKTKYATDDSDTEYENYEDSDRSSIIDGVFLEEETVDAAVKFKVSLPSAKDVLTVEKVKDIENELDTEEIISLLYLLVEDSKEIEFQLQTILLMMKGGSKRGLSLWAEYHSHKNQKWKNRLVEALCVIKNYKVLDSLGYEKSNVIDHFLPNNVNTIHISKLKKVIYLICENLDVKETKDFLGYIRENFNNRKIQFNEFGEEFLEVYFLKWESIKQLDLQHIKSVLKVMGQESLYNNVEVVLREMPSSLPPQNISQDVTYSVVKSPSQLSFQNIAQLLLEDTGRPTTSRSSSSDNCFPSDDMYRLRNRKISSGTSVDNQPQTTTLYGGGVSLPYWQNTPLKSIVQNKNFLEYQHSLKELEEFPNKESQTSVLADCYQIDSNNPGVVLIINQEKFFTEFRKEYQNLLPKCDYKLEERRGTEKDRDNLELIFKRFGFKVIVRNNLDHLDMLKVIKGTVQEVTDESSLFICILSHGDEGVVYGSNSCHVKVRKIEEIISGTNKTNLDGKPKILILQSCQGQQCQKLDSTDVDDEHTSLSTDGPSITHRDLLTFWATIPGYAAIRNRKQGTWFIQALYKNMEQHAHNSHFADICTKVNGEIHQQCWDNDGKNIMTPLLIHTFGKRFYLPKLGSGHYNH